MTESELRLECLKLAVKHFFPRELGFGMPSDEEVVSDVAKLAEEYQGYVKTGLIPKGNSL